MRNPGPSYNSSYTQGNREEHLMPRYPSSPSSSSIRYQPYDPYYTRRNQDERLMPQSRIRPSPMRNRPYYSYYTQGDQDLHLASPVGIPPSSMMDRRPYDSYYTQRNQEERLSYSPFGISPSPMYRPFYDSYYTHGNQEHPAQQFEILPSPMRYEPYESYHTQGNEDRRLASQFGIPPYHPKIQEEPPKQTTQENLLFNMKFSLDIAKHVILENLRKNQSVAFSPTSVDAVLRILAVGSQNSTLEQFLNLLGHNDVQEVNATATKLFDVLKTSDNEDASEISYVNALWLNQCFSLKDGFKQVLREVYNARTRVCDFVNKADEVIEEANSWAKRVTKGLIEQILRRNSIQSDTMLLLANALYFKGTWQNSFRSENTKDGTFNLLNGHKVHVPFMNQWSVEFDYGAFNTCEVIRMPYKGGNSSKYLSMYVFLPHEKDGLPNFLEEIKIDENMFNDQFKLKKVNVDILHIPKFKVEFEISLTNTMKQLGFISPFDRECKDFTEIVTESTIPFYVTEIMQKCVVETNEQGTVAAAVTMFTIAYGCAAPLARPPPIEFVADHPFMFIIREDISGAILFVGTMLNPQ